MKKKMNKKGFTIVELVIVIAVIAILAAVMIPTFAGVVDKANASKALQEVKNAYTATLANDLSTADTSDDVVYGEDEIKVIVDNKYTVIISANGEATVADKAESDNATHTLSSGLLVAATQSGNTEGGEDAGN